MLANWIKINCDAAFKMESVANLSCNNGISVIASVGLQKTTFV